MVKKQDYVMSYFDDDGDDEYLTREVPAVEETQEEKDIRINAELAAAKSVDTQPNPGKLPETPIHDTRGNVRQEVTDLGIGTVTLDDVIQSDRFEFRKRDDGRWDIYNRNGGLVVVGATTEDLENYK